jgi:hypothetical protein
MAKQPGSPFQPDSANEMRSDFGHRTQSVKYVSVIAALDGARWHDSPK